MPPIPCEQRIEPSHRRRWCEPHHDASVPPRVTGVDDPRDVVVLMDFHTGHNTFRHEPLGMLAFDEERLFEIYGTRSRAGWSCTPHTTPTQSSTATSARLAA
jgi:hypothetical protein